MSTDTVIASEPPKGAPQGARPSGGVSAWCRLLRLPNQLTVPGDPLAGAVLAAAALGIAIPWSPVFQSVLASLSFYAAGLLANDYCDREEDARDRPHRPIPSGAVPARGVLVSAIVANVAAVAFAAQAGAGALIVALVLTPTLWAYNLGLKRSPLFGPFVMGLCRGLSLLLGAAAACGCLPRSPAPWVAAAILIVYIAAVTAIARNETLVQRTPVWRLCAPSLTVLLGLAALAVVSAGSLSLAAISGMSGLALGLSAMAVAWVAICSRSFAGVPAPEKVQQGVGALIRGLILMQAAFCAATSPAGETVALGILVLFPVSGWLGKWFYGS